jgi:hypothetical protein
MVHHSRKNAKVGVGSRTNELYLTPASRTFEVPHREGWVDGSVNIHNHPKTGNYDPEMIPTDGIDWSWALILRIGIPQHVSIDYRSVL